MVDICLLPVATNGLLRYCLVTCAWTDRQMNDIVFRSVLGFEELLSSGLFQGGCAINAIT